MNLPPRILGAIALAASTASLAAPSLAGAATPPKAGERTYEQTYPEASRVCGEVAAGKRKRLHPFAAQVLADCTALQSGFTAAQSTVLAARAAITSSIAADRAAVVAACPKPLRGRPACESTRRSEHRAIAVLRDQLIAASRRYYRTVEANRRIFWHAIRSLPGQSHLREDAPIVPQNS